MTLPNKLTIIRLLTTPLVFLAWYLPFHLGFAPRVGSIIIWILFIISEITDVLDGYFARRSGQVSDIGKLMDPFADVFLRITYFICFVGAGLMPVWALVIIVWRELGIMFIRMLLTREGIVLAAGVGGKIKSSLYFISGLGGLAALTLRVWWPSWRGLEQVESLAAVLFTASALAALISFVDYFRRYLRTATYRNFISG